MPFTYNLVSLDGSRHPTRKADLIPLTMFDLNRNLLSDAKPLVGSMYVRYGEDGSKTPIYRFNGLRWNEWEPDLSFQQARAYRAALDGKNLFITGSGGNGKTLLVRRIVQDLRDQGKVIAVTASTGIAAIQAGGMTIHSYLGTGISRNAVEARATLSVDKVERVRFRLKATHVLILDEVSMLTGDYIDMMDKWMQFILHNKKPFGGIQVILVGDALQLPPVVTEKDEKHLDKRYFFQAKAWHAGSFETHHLTVGFRQGDDQELKDHLAHIRYGKAPEATLKYFNSRVNAKLEESDPTKLYPLRCDVEQANEDHLASLPGEAFGYSPIYEGNEKWIASLQNNLPCEDPLVLCEGAKVMFTKNNLKEGYANGTRGVVVDCTDDSVKVQTKAGEIDVERAVWEMKDPQGDVLASVSNYAMVLAAAVTVHKSQGATMEWVEFDPSRIFERGQTYVALSRVTKLSGLRLTSPLESKHVRASKLCVDFYKELQTSE